MRYPASIATVITAASIGVAMAQQAQVQQAANYRQLSAQEIRTRVIGMAITDDAHWSDRFYRDGTLKSYDLGHLQTGTWKLAGNELCLSRKGKTTTTDCLEIWAARDAIQYRRDGVVVADGYLREIPK
jgi:hypothetical protein